MFNLTRRGSHERAGFKLYTAVVGAARNPLLFSEMGIPDTLDGRFDVVCLHAVLLLRRLRALPAPGPALAQSVFDAMFSDMDVNLREMGMGDLSVGKRVRAMWEALHGRAAAYETAIEAADEAALADALGRNVWRGDAPQGSARRLAAAALAQDRHLATQPLAALARGEVDFLDARVVA